MQHSYSSREAADLFGADVDATSIQRAIKRGELTARKKGPHPQSPFVIEHDDLVRWAADRGLPMVNGAGERVNVATGEVLAEGEQPTPIARAAAARARLAGVVAPAPGVELWPGTVAGADVPPSPARAESNVARVVLPSAEAGLLEACRRLAALPESPELWAAMRAVLGVSA